MSTKPFFNLTAASGWVEAAAADEEFLIEIIEGSVNYIKVCFKSTTPDGDDGYHPLYGGRSFIRAGLVGKVWISADGDAKVAVTV
jgi:hypothetical protein